MSPFNAKPLATLTVGEQLEQARRQRGWSAAEVSRATGIGLKFIQALEADRHDVMPGDVYVRRWLRQLGPHLQLNGEAMVAQWFEERRRVEHGGAAAAPARTTVTPRQLRWTAAALVTLGALGFLGVRLYAVVAPPPLEISSPAAGTTSLSDVFSVEVSGTTAPEASVTVNGQVVTTAVGGEFNLTVPLHRGVNIVAISSRTKHSFTATVRRVVTVDSSPEGTAGVAP